MFRTCFFAVLLLSAAPFSEGRLQEQKTGTIEILAFEPSGHEIPRQKISAQLFNLDGKLLPITFHDGIAENVPHGAYYLEVGSPVFATERKKIDHHIPRSVWHFTLEVLSIADTVPLP